MRILGVETTCDETSVAIVENGQEVLYEFTLSQAKKHSRYGGVVPELAAREHVKNLQGLLPELIEVVDKYNPHAVAVAAKIGLPPAVKTGEAFARGLAAGLGVELIEVNHVIAHIWGVWLEPSIKPKPQFPLLGVIVSGGHTMIIRFKSPTEFEVLGTTEDDAIGEVFDKVARELGLGYPGGPKIETLAKLGDEFAIELPIPLANVKDIRLSFAGLKTATINLYRNLCQKTYKEYKEFLKQDVAASFQRVAFLHLIANVEKAIEKTGLHTVVLGGGVSANQRLIDLLAQRLDPAKVQLYIPPLRYTGDNAALIAGYAYAMSNYQDVVT